MENYSEESVGACYIPAHIMVRDDLSMSEKVIYGRVLALSNNKGYCYATNTYLGEQVGLKSGTVSDIVSKLVSLDLVRREIIRDDLGKIQHRKLFPFWIAGETQSDVDRNGQETHSGKNRNGVIEVGHAQQPTPEKTGMDSMRSDTLNNPLRKKPEGTIDILKNTKEEKDSFFKKTFIKNGEEYTLQDPDDWHPETVAVDTPRQNKTRGVVEINERISEILLGS